MVSRAVIAVIRAYKIYVSPLFPASCRFTPSCSQYAVDAIGKYGLLRGGAKGCWRIMRCHPFSKGGSDPVD